MKNATMITGILLIIVGSILWMRYETMDKLFSLAANFIASGIGFIIISLILRVKKW